MKYKPTHNEGNLRFWGRNNIKGAGNRKSETHPRISHIEPIFATKLIILST